MRLFYQYKKSAMVVILLLAVAGGATALAHQLLWTRRMVDLMGASAGSAARVFGCFFFGLAVGSFLGAWLAPRASRPWRWLASAELLIALLCVPMLFLTQWADGLWPWLGPDRLTGWMGGSIKTALSIGMVFPPAVVMGLFLPLAVIGWPSDTPRRDPGLWLYAVNTLGAVVGIVLVTAWMLPRFGMQRVMLAAILANVLAAAGGFVLDAGGCGWRSLTPSHRWRLVDTLPRPTFLLLAAVSGGLMMASEVIALLVVQLLAPLSFFAPAAVLAVFILLLAAGAFVVAAVRNRFTSLDCLGPIAFWAGIGLVLTPSLFHLLAPRFPIAVEQASLSGFLLRLGGFTVLVFGPAIFAGSLWFPAMARCSGEGNPKTDAYRWGWLLAANGVGGWLGTEIAYGILLPSVGPFTGLGVLGFLYVVTAWILQPGDARMGSVWLMRTGIASALCMVWFVHPRLSTVHPQFVPFVLEQRHGREGSLAILESPDMGRALLLQNQYLLGSTQAALQQERQAHIPLLLHPRPVRVGFIGLATGSTAGAALEHTAVESVEVTEISRTVAEAARQWFGDANRQIATESRARIAIEDGRTWLAAHVDAFDVLISDLFLPWGPGEGRLYTLEHFQAAKRSLRSDGGLFCLWLPMYQLIDPQFMVILNTFLQVFDRAELMQWDHSDAQPAVAVIGWRNEDDFGVDERVFEQRTGIERLGDQQLLDTDYLRSLYIGRAERGLIGSPLNTLGNLWIELDAGRTRVMQPETAPYLYGARWREWREALQQGLDHYRQPSRY